MIMVGAATLSQIGTTCLAILAMTIVTTASGVFVHVRRSPALWRFARTRSAAVHTSPHLEFILSPEATNPNKPYALVERLWITGILWCLGFRVSSVLGPENLIREKAENCRPRMPMQGVVTIQDSGSRVWGGLQFP